MPVLAPRSLRDGTFIQKDDFNGTKQVVTWLQCIESDNSSKLV
jgi:hypothetical protein